MRAAVISLPCSGVVSSRFARPSSITPTYLSAASMMMVLPSLAVLLLVNLAQGYPYSSYSTKRYNRASYRPPYVPLPIPYALPQTYDDNQEDVSQGYIPSYYYNPYRSSYYRMDPVNQMSTDTSDQTSYPFGQEMWYEGGADNIMSAAASAAATREAILQNLIIAQMYEDAAASAAVSGFPYYQLPLEDTDNKNWKYGVPTTGIEEKEKAREFLKKEEDEEVKELENLRKSEANKEARRRRKQKAKEAKEAKEAKQEQEMMRAMGLVKRQENSVSTESPLLTEAALAKQAVNSGRKTNSGGQKEVVLLQPARPAREPFTELTERLHSRSSEPSVYQTIKQLLTMENDYRKTDNARIKKRFISTEEQLTEQLRGLNKRAL